MIVMKFGGSSLNDAKRIRSAASIITGSVESRPVVVVSALGGVTDSLVNIARAATNGNVRADLLSELARRHYGIVDDLGLAHSTIAREIGELVCLGTDTKWTRGMSQAQAIDHLVSFGERMSARIVAGYIGRVGHNARAYDSYDIGFVTDSNFGDADVPEVAYPGIGRSLMGLNHIPVVTGFIGRDPHNRITTLGRGGSDYTATIIGASIGAEEIQIWKDVDGIMTADPRVVPGARKVTNLSVDEALELAVLGAKVLHRSAMIPAIRKGIPVRIMNTFSPDSEGTIIDDNAILMARVASITRREPVRAINISTPRMSGAAGFLHRIFAVFGDHQVAVNMVSTSEINVSLTVNGNVGINGIVPELRRIGEVEVREERSEISLVGHRINEVPDIFTTLFSALRGIGIEMTSSPMSDISLSLVVRDGQSAEAVRRLHSAFFGA